MGERESNRAVDVGRVADAGLASRKRAAIELIRSHERTLRRTARRYSLCADDAEDALQRALEILLIKAPTSDQRELIRWMQTVTKHEALAVRRSRERTLATPGPPSQAEDSDWVQLIPSDKDGPADTAERRERIGRAREALGALKPQELRALTLLAEGYSYAEITELTGWTYTKVNRCLAEGRQRFRAVLGAIEEGRRCEELAPSLSTFVDGEATATEGAQLRAHLRECIHCRAKMRAFRAAPRAAAALAPIAPAGKSLGGRLHDLVAAAHSRLPGRTGAADAAVGQLAAAGGSRGTGMALAAKVLAACLGTAGGTAACVAAGVVAPVHIGSHGGSAVHANQAVHQTPAQIGDGEQTIAASLPAPAPEPSQPTTPPAATSDPEPTPPSAPAAAEFTPEAAPGAPVAHSSGTTEFGGPSGSGGSGGSASSVPGGEFGP
jgi:RNA polymerase sigma factor (sigma-70 family)